MYFRLTTSDGKQYDFTSSSATIAAFKSELGSEALGYVTTNGTNDEIIGINMIRNGIVTISPIPPNNPPAGSGGTAT